jgi:pyruvate dehydrogenase E2 component (dihydrolipoamide acetyltransferase)
MAEVIMPKMGDAMESGTLIAWKVKDGDSVKLGDIIAEIETDKSNVEIEAEEAGVFHRTATEGEVIPVGQVIAQIGDVPAASTAPAPRNGTVAPKADLSSWKPPVAASAPAAGVEAERVKASPLARKIAKEKGIDIVLVHGTGPHGRIVEQDVLDFVQSPKLPPAKSAEPAPLPVPTAPKIDVSSWKPPKPAAPPAPAAAAPASIEDEIIELSQMRKVIARRMQDSKSTIPHFYVTIDVDVEAISALREKLNSYDPSLQKISLNDMIVKAAGKALAKFPDVCSAYRDNKIVRFAGQHVGIAVAIDDGLIVPVVRNVSTIPLRDVARTSRDLILKARNKKLSPNEYSGGSFTVSNLGAFDVDNFIAIIDPSQGAILAVSSIVKKPVVLEDDTIAVRKRMKLTLSGDHRVIDGATGAKFMQEVKRLIQNPLSLLE